MIDAFVEGVRSIYQVCHLVILAPVALTILAARGRWQAVAGAVLGVIVGGWIFVSGWFGSITDTELRVTALIVIAGVLALALPRIFSDSIRTTLESPLTAAGIAGGIAVLVTQWWRPCVGVELGSILTNAPDDPFGQLLPTIGFMLGISIPLIVIGLVYAVWQPARGVAGKVGWAGAALCVLLAVSVVAGQHGEVVSRLFQWSQ